MPRPALPILAIFVLACASAPAALEYNRDVRPILSDKCFACHGPDKASRKAKLRLDVREDALAASAFVPGDAAASELIARIISDDPDEVMPPPEGHNELSPGERDTLQQWVTEGAEYQPHWAYLAPVRPAVPDHGFASPIDNFVAAQLAETPLSLSPRADAPTLARRLHFDLTGLPPTTGDLAEISIDDLLDNPAFGERMAVFWLDLARYADSVGYHGDQERDISPYRDYVINAFNANLPYDQFVIEQLAGDLLENPTRDQLVATTFNRANQLSAEGGIQDAEYLAKYYGERVRTTSIAFLGSTMGCAECHDHKFDPFTTKDFYAMEAYFSDILEKGAYNGDGSYNPGADFSRHPRIEDSRWGPMMRVPSSEEEAAVDKVEREIAETEGEIERKAAQLDGSFSTWLAEALIQLCDSTPKETIILDDREYALPGGIEIVTDPVASGEIARRQSADELIQHIVEIKSAPVAIEDGDRLFANIYLDPENPPEQIMLQFNAGESWNHRAWWGIDRIPFGRGGSPAGHFSAGELPATGEWVRVEVSAGDLGLGAGDKVDSVAFTQFGGTVTWDHSGRVTSSREAFLGSAADDVRDILTALSDAPPSEAQTLILRAHYETIAPELDPLRDRIVELQKRRTDILGSSRSTLVTVSATPREIRVLPRGDWTNGSGPVVVPEIPEFLQRGNADSPTDESRATRLDLARWIVSPENPLTARTFVNRIWKQFFGAGISRNLNDLGNQGEWPTHPELLDWLAAEFMESGWDVKHLISLIASSETYQQTSDVPAAQRMADPGNRLLARQVPRRLAAEFVRDNALAVSGLLVEKLGGTSARPYQPPGYYANLNFPKRKYKPDTGDNQYRRGLYTHWQRTFLHPMLVAFDAPAREECTADRSVSNTPLQALDLLNDPTFVEAARALATGAIEDSPDRDERLRSIFVRALTRQPAAQEMALLVELWEQQFARYQKTPADAEALIAIGLKPNIDGSAAPELAAYTAAARAVLNLHETITVY